MNAVDLKETDISLTSDTNADPSTETTKYISRDILEKYEVYSYRHAAAILATSYPNELNEIEDALRQFSLTKKEIGTPGGNESIIPRKFNMILRPYGWEETRIKGDLLVKIIKSNNASLNETKIENFIDGHKIDYVKGKVAFDLEWNSKDQTFDRDLYAFRTFHECGIISIGIMVTRGTNLSSTLREIPQLNKQGDIQCDKNGKIKKVGGKYGASTTWMGKLLYRLNAGRHGSCPILAFGITAESIQDQ